MRRRTKVVLWIAVGAVVVFLFAATAARRLRTEDTQSIESVQSAEGVPVDYVLAQATPIAHWMRFAGVAEGFGQVELVSDYRTRVSRVHVDVGDEIAAGKVVISLDEYDPTRIMVNLETARAQYTTARRDSARMEALYESGAISQQQLDHAGAEADAARAAYNTARRAVRLDSPISGIVTAVYVEEGEYADAGQILATVASLDETRIPLDVSPTQRAGLEPGQTVRVFPGKGLGTGEGEAGRERPLYGTVTKVSLSADPETRLFRVELVVRNPGHVIKPGSLVEPEIKIASCDSCPVVPETALVEINGIKAVYVITGSQGDETAELRDVVPGISWEGLLAITRGIDPGERVVVWGQGKLRDGLKTKPHNDLTSQYFAAGVGGERSK